MIRNSCYAVLASLWLLLLTTASRANGQTPPAAPRDGMADTVDTLLDFSAAPIQQPEPVETNRVKWLHKQALALRDPFWPVGYTPPRKEAPKQTDTVRQPTAQAPTEAASAERPPKWDEAMRALSIKGIMSIGAGKYTAVINDQVVGENDTVTVTFEGSRYSWKIIRIGADGVKFQKLMVTK